MNLSPIMEKGLALARASGELVRHPGGFWAGPFWKRGEPYVPTGTVRALEQRGFLSFSKSLPGGFPVAARLNVFQKKNRLTTKSASERKDAMKKPSGHGGKRVGAGRPPLPEEERRATTSMKMLPGADAELEHLAAKARCGKNGVVEWLTLSPSAGDCRELCVNEAAIFIRAEDGRDSPALTQSKAALRRQVKRKLSARIGRP